MPLWDKLRVELDRAGRVAQGALDEGRLTLEAMRARRRADQAAQVLGYAVYRARKAGRELEPEEYARLSSTIAAHEADAARHNAAVAELRARGTAPPSGAPLSGPVRDPAAPADQTERSRPDA